tara:strand:- start:256 stop:570 length:315 start_codon:yes stop_codon:yes gene_type:complete
MKTYILMKNINNLNNAEDIKVSDIYGIYQNRCKAFWECKIANLKLKKNIFDFYVIKEINLENNNIDNSYKLIDRLKIIDEHKEIYEIPVFYNDIKREFDDILYK